MHDLAKSNLVTKLKKNFENCHARRFKKAAEWSKRKAEFEKRAGFALMASLAVHDKKAGDSQFKLFFPDFVVTSPTLALNSFQPTMDCRNLEIIVKFECEDA